MISFTTIGVSIKINNKRLLYNWINEIVSRETKKICEVSYVFCSDEVLLKYNEQYLHHGDYTDIITFDYSEGDRIGGDIMISSERVKENAKKYNVSFEEEMSRVMAHGILHLCGYKDKKKEETKLMRGLENKYMELFPKQAKPFFR